MVDPTTANWIAEFVLRQRIISDGLANAIFLALPCSTATESPSLRRAILLRRLSSDLSSRRFSPRTLRVIELLQSPSPFASDAYLSIATHLVVSAPDFASAVSSLFLHRIGGVLKSPGASGLVSDRLKAVSEEMEKALTDPVLREQVVARDTLKEAIGAVRVFLDKAWEEIELQPCFLEKAAQLTVQRRASAQRKETSISNPIPSPEVRKLVQDLRSARAELKETIKDPLPEAIKMANEVAESLREKLRQEETHEQVDVGAAGNCKGKDVISTGEEVTGTGLPKRSLMDRNPTARSYEWSDTIESASEISEGIARRFHLASPKRIPVSPLRQVTKRKPGTSTRRKSQKWTVLEEDTLRKAVEEIGRGNWTEILDQYRFIFDNRTAVDLKDKWRNMTRS